MIGLVVAAALFAQTTVWPFTPGERAYTGAEPVRDDRFALLTLSGAYSTELLEPCAGHSDIASSTHELAAGVSVLLYANADGTLSLAPIGADGQVGAPCQIAVLYMSTAPCFTDATGQCNAAALPN